VESEINKRPSEDAAECPRLVISRKRGDDLVVMMFDETHGVVVHDGSTFSGRNPDEFYWENWDMENFKPFHGSICLKS